MRLSCFMPALASAFLLACNGTDGGGTGDPHSKPNPNELGDGDRVTDVVGPATWLDVGNMNSAGCKSPADHQISLTGQVIVALDTYDETGAGQTGNIYLEDVPEAGGDPAPYSGLEVFGPSFTPPDLRVFEGDVVDTNGLFTEFLGPSSGFFGDCKTLPELNGTLSFRFENGPRAPLTIVQAGADPSRFDSIRGYDKARQWLGMLVRIEGVSLPNAPTCSACPNKDCTQCTTPVVGRYSAVVDIGGGITSGDNVSISNELMDVTGQGPPIAAMTQFKSVTGIWTYFYGFHIAPRSAADFEL